MEQRTDMMLQVNTAGAWRNVLTFEPAQRETIVAALAPLARLLGEGTTWCIHGPDGKRQWLHAEDFAAPCQQDGRVDEGMVDRYLAAQKETICRLDRQWGTYAGGSNFVREACKAGLEAAIAQNAKGEAVGYVTDETGGPFARFTEAGHRLAPGTPLYSHAERAGVPEAKPARCPAHVVHPKSSAPGPRNPPLWCCLPEGHDGPHRHNGGGMYPSIPFRETDEVSMLAAAPSRPAEDFAARDWHPVTATEPVPLQDVMVSTYFEGDADAMTYMAYRRHDGSFVIAGTDSERVLGVYAWRELGDDVPAPLAMREKAA